MELLGVKIRKVSELMSRNILVAHTTYSFSEVLRLFSGMTFHHLPVVDSNNKVVGIVSSNDVLRILSNQMFMLSDLKDETINQAFDITDIMSGDPIFVSPDSTIEEALKLFHEHQIHALPVVKEDQLVGIITSNDILKVWMG